VICRTIKVIPGNLKKPETIGGPERDTLSPLQVLPRAMKSVGLLLAAAVATVSPALADPVPFYWQNPGQEYSAAVKKGGKMEQIGRTGVAAMHAVLIR
jgi:hypothetical protein